MRSGARLRGNDQGIGRTPLPSALLVVAVTGLALGAVLAWTGSAAGGDVFTAVAVAGVPPALWWMVRDLRSGRVGVDLIAVLAVVGSLVVGQPLAGAVITLMLATGRVLEAKAGERAERDLRALVAHQPRTARRIGPAGLVVVELDDVVPGDLLLVVPGDVLGVDGRVEPVPGSSGPSGATLDESALSGEALPVERPVGDLVRSGVVNGGGTFGLRATTTAEDGTYAGLVRLVDSARSTSSRFVRTADRAAAVFLPLTLLVAGAVLLLTGDLTRSVAVLVVATPCPLLLAAPIAVVAGLSRAARRGVVVKGGAALEDLGRATVLCIDKTGTVTEGRPRVGAVTTTGGPDAVGAGELLRLAASLEQVSSHVFATAVVMAATDRGLDLEVPTDVVEVPGRGLSGCVGGRDVRVGGAAFVQGPGEPADPRSAPSAVHVGVDGAWAGSLLVEDPVRADAAATLDRLRSSGIHQVVMLTGDDLPTARAVAELVGVDELHADCSPRDKVEVVHRLSADAVTVMVGDGVNDAPALAAATVGVALGARGSSATSEAADVVLTVDLVERLADAMDIARRSRAVAAQSVWVGMGLSVGAMGLAATGHLGPLAGAVTQEGIDVLTILNALRALGPGRRRAEESGPRRDRPAEPGRTGPVPAVAPLEPRE